MYKKILFAAAVFTAVCCTYYAVSRVNEPEAQAEIPFKELKIASLSPVITETLYVLGLGDKIAADTIYCNYPPEAAGKPKLGTMMTVNYEYAVSLGINAAVLHTGMDKQKENFENLGIRTVELDMKTAEGILNSFDRLGDAFGIREISDKAKNKMSGELYFYAAKKTDGKKPRILVVIFRPEGTGSIEKVTAAGRSGVYNDIIELIGAENAVKDKKPYPEISKEGIISINPDIIIEISHKTAPAAAGEWQSLKNTVNAVKNGRVYVTGEPVMSLPGPRLPEIAEYFANTLESMR